MTDTNELPGGEQVEKRPPTVADLLELLTQWHIDPIWDLTDSDSNLETLDWSGESLQHFLASYQKLVEERARLADGYATAKRLLGLLDGGAVAQAKAILRLERAVFPNE